jgi:hypothetical protein
MNSTLTTDHASALQRVCNGREEGYPHTQMEERRIDVERATAELVDGARNQR